MTTGSRSGYGTTGSSSDPPACPRYPPGRQGSSHHAELARSPVDHSREVLVNLIGNTRRRTGVEIHSELDESAYQIAIKVTDAELAAMRLKKDRFHGEWNYSILPRN